MVGDTAAANTTREVPVGSIDSDANVIECEATFNYMDPEYESLRSMVVVQKSGAAEIA
jgi:hypothetical protein